MSIWSQLLFIVALLLVDLPVTKDLLLQNPTPVPQGVEAVVTCSATTEGIIWSTSTVNTTTSSVQAPYSAVGYVWRSSQLFVPALPANNNTMITCKTFEHQENTIQLYIYGHPAEPGDLSSESVSDGVLVFSWSPPWAPDGVQLNYTLTVTNTNTSVVTVFTTSDTSITVTRDNITSSSQCDQYVWSVTAVNPAGSSVPANYNTAVYFPCAPNTDVCINSKATLLNIKTQSCTSTENK